MNGWAVSSDALESLVSARYPNVDHLIVDSVENWTEEAYRNIDDVDWVLGYSTGAFLLLMEKSILKRAKNVMLFAPFIDFRVESDLGGKTRRGQLEFLVRWLRKDPIVAIADFYQRAELRFSTPPKLSLKVNDLIWGIELLRDTGLEPEVLQDYPIRIGSEDTLIDANRIAELGKSVLVVEGASHDLGSLLDGWEGFS